MFNSQLKRIQIHVLYMCLHGWPTYSPCNSTLSVRKPAQNDHENPAGKNIHGGRLDVSLQRMIVNRKLHQSHGLHWHEKLQFSITKRWQTMSAKRSPGSVFVSISRSDEQWERAPAQRVAVQSNHECDAIQFQCVCYARIPTGSSRGRLVQCCQCAWF